MKSPSAPCRRFWSSMFLAAVLIAPLASCGEPPPPLPPDVQNLRAFAKLYGYVRFFHPSDEAASIDWDRFAVLGVIRIREVADPADLPGAMERLFGPMAPTVQIHPTGHEPLPVSTTVSLAESHTVAWQHLGVQLPGRQQIYRSKRTNRDLRITSGPGFGTVIQSVDAAPYQGRSVRLTASVRTAVTGDDNQGQMWLRVDRASGERGFFDNMGDRPITGADWRRVEIVGGVAEDATHIVFGCFLAGEGRVWVDDFELQVQNDDASWSSIEIENPGFEEGEIGAPPPGWRAATPGYSFAVSDEGPSKGARSVRINDGPYDLLTEDLFEARPESGELIEAELGAGLSARIPLALSSVDGATVPAGDEVRMKAMRTELDSIAMYALSEYSECTRLAGIVIAWNVIQHFYPYFDEVDVDWDAQLTRSLERTLADESGEDYFETLREMAAAIQDGHAMVDHQRYRPTGYLPFEVDWVGDRIVIDSDEYPGLERGDVLETIDGVDARTELERIESRVSGSPQLKRARALFMLGADEAGSQVELTVLRGDDRLEVSVELGAPDGSGGNEPREKIEEIEDGIFYVDLRRATMEEINERMAEIASARGVIFDLRGYPNGNHQVIGHLLDKPDTSMAWMRVPQIIYPDHVEPPGWWEQGWGMQPLQPHIDGTVVFITDANAISYAESFLGLVEGYALAEIVGQPTAGTNGNINPMTLPGRFTFVWTGMKVVKHDGSQHHLVGISPTVRIKRTLKGVREGRDEFLERALEIARGSTNG